MKKILNKTGWLLGVILTAAIAVLLFTFIVQKSMETVAHMQDTVISDSILFGVSGTIGAGLGAILLWFAIRKIKTLRFYKPTHPRGHAWTVAYILLTLMLCRVILPGLWAYCSGDANASAAASDSAGEEPLWMMLLMGVTVAPICEELLFRKDIFSLLSCRISTGWTVAWSALLFALIHGYNAEGFVSCLLAGILFGILMARTGSLMACIAAHILCNLEACVYNLLESRGTTLITDINGHTAYHPTIFVTAILIAAACALYLHRTRTSAAKKVAYP